MQSDGAHIDLARLNFRDFFEKASFEAPDELFLIGSDEGTSYAAFNERADRAANAWYRLGVRKGDRVAFMVDNGPAFLEAWFGLAKIGAILNAVNTGYTYQEAEFQVLHCEPSAILTSPQHVEIVEQIASRARGLRVLQLGPHEYLDDFIELIDMASPEAPRADLNGDDVISLIYTSGTTGRPKAVMQTHRSYVLTGESWPTWLDVRRADRLYVCLPYFHINSQAYSTMGAIGARAGIVLAPRFSASRFWPDVRQHRVTHFNFMGAMMVILSRQERSIDDLDNSVRIAYGGTKLPPGLQADVERRFGLEIISGFGMSETPFGMVEDIHGYRRPGSIGKPRQHPDRSIPVNEARLVEPSGQDIQAEGVGQLLLRNPAMALGYFKDPQRTSESFRDGWLHTGDILRRDSDGYYFFVDRTRDVIRRRGENVSSSEVERVLMAHPDVHVAAVVGVPSELTDEDVLAFVTPRPNRTVDPATVLEWCTRHLARFKVPRYVRVMDELPRTASHKIRKELLRADWRQPDIYDREAEQRSSQ